MIVLNDRTFRPSIPGGFEDQDQDQDAVYTGFRTFTGPGSANVPDAGAAFSGYFNQVDRHPAFTAETDALRSTMNGLARAARKGDVNAATGYESVANELSTRKRLYDLGYSIGLNDRNANDAWKLAVSGVEKTDFTDPGQYYDRHVQYLAREALQRGQNISSIKQAQDLMDRTFRMSYVSALSAGKSVDPSTAATADTLSQNAGHLKTASLAMREALQTWESKNGLRDDATRADILAKAAEFLGSASLSRGLRRMVNDPLAVVTAAAQSVGAADGDRNDNLFDRYSNEMARLRNGFITYSGSTDMDYTSSYGATPKASGRTRAYAAVERAFSELLASNAMNGADDLWDVSDPETRRQLHSDLVTALSSLPTGAGRFGAASRRMFDDVAENLISQATTNQSVDLSDIGTIYTDPRFTAVAEQEQYVHEDSGKFKEMTSLAGRVVDDLIQNRSLISFKFNSDLLKWATTGPSDVRSVGPTTYGGSAMVPGTSPATPIPDSAKEPEYTAAGISAAVDRRLQEAFSSPEMQAFASANQQFVADLAATMKEYVLTANTKADRFSADYDNVAEYRKGLSDRVAALYIANELRKISLSSDSEDHVVNGAWRPVSTMAVDDKDVRGRTKRNLRNTYGGLLAEVDGWLSRHQGVDTAAMSDVDYAKWHMAESIRKGLSEKIESNFRTSRGGNDPARLRAEISGANADQDLGFRDGGFSMSNLRWYRDAMSVRKKERLAASSPLKPGVSADQAVALRMLSQGVFSDVANPRLASRAAEYVDKRLSEEAPSLTREQRAVYADRLRWAVLSSMREIMRDTTVDPAQWNQDSALYDRLDKVTAPAFSRASAASKAMDQLLLRQIGEKRFAAGMADNEVRERREDQ